MPQPTHAVCEPNENDSGPWPTDEHLGTCTGPAIAAQVSWHCDSCCNLKMYDWMEYPSMGFSFAGIRESASRGCDTCKALSSLLTPHIGPWAEGDTGIEVHLMERDERFDSSPIRFRLTTEGNEEGRLVEIFWPHEYTTQIQLRGNVGSNFHEWTHFYGGYLATGPQWILSTKRWVNRCIEKCVNNHGECPALKESRLPTRILRIQGPLNSPKVHLHESVEQDQAKYACLSHCWGDAREGYIPLQTTHENNLLERFRLNIPWKDLPLTFQDAIVVALELEIEYLWVDSLCIIQDDDSDWKKEAAKMSEVYANAFITIAATASPHSRGGLFGAAQAAQRRQSYVLMKSPDGSATLPLCSRISAQHWWQYYAPESTCGENYGVESRDANVFPLLHRGWIFQERILSPRVLHFSRDEVILECAHGNTCQCFGEWLQGSSHIQELLKPHFSAQKLLSLKDQKDTTTAMASWRQVLEQYSVLQFTFAKDRVPALAGIARLFLPIFKGKHFAGVWEDALATILAWNLVKRVERRSRPDRDLLIPSWSPLSSPGFIKLQDTLLNPTLEIISLPGGRTSEDLTSIQNEKTPIPLSIRAHALTTRMACSNNGIEFLTNLDTTWLRVDYKMSTDRTRIDVLVVNIGSYGARKGCYISLVLREKPDSNPPLYERIGLAKHWSNYVYQVDKLPKWKRIEVDIC
ncbi:HET-domain-containing protein [Acephala macrosclerotiorum]|nr:HET-domain-containing protein [Acephala macrosclerotiorum]